MAEDSRWSATMDTDGSGNWEIQLPADASREDLLALSPVIEAMRDFIQPTVDAA